jgi:hypothetical protein
MSLFGAASGGFAQMKPRLRVCMFHGTETVPNGADVAASHQRVIDAATSDYDQWLDGHAGRLLDVDSVKPKHHIVPCDQGYIISCTINVIYH